MLGSPRCSSRPRKRGGSPATAGDAPLLSQDAGELAVIDTATDTVVKTLTLRQDPRASPSRATAGALSSPTPRRRRSPSSISRASPFVETLPYPGTPFGIAAGPAGRLYISDWNRDVLTYVEGELRERAGEIVIGRSPAGVALSPDGKLAFAANRESDTVSIITTNDWTLAATVPVGRAPFALAVSPDGARVYVANVQGGSLSVIDVKRRADHRHHQGRRNALRRGPHGRRL